MPVDIGRISGIMLKDNLLRQGEDLKFETNLLYLDVNTHAQNPLLVDGTGRVGIKTTSPTNDFEVVGRSRTTNLISDLSFTNGEATIDTSRFTTNLGPLYFDAVTYVFSPESRTNDISVNNNVIRTISLLEATAIDGESATALPVDFLDGGSASTLVFDDILDLGTAAVVGDSNTNLEIRPNGDGVLQVYANTNITGSLYASGDITLDGDITFGSDTSDAVTFNSDIRSDILPDQDDVYNLGEDPLTGKRWSELRTQFVNGQLLETTSVEIPEGMNLALRPGNTWFVAVNGSDTNEGDHENGPFLTIKHALSVAQYGDEVYVYPGTYLEELPLVVPAGVHVRGANIRLTMVAPAPTYEYNNVFELNGQCTISDMTIKDFFYDSINDTGYAFSFVSGALISERSPYIQNTSVITKGSVTTVDDPMGFDAGDAGRGAKVDGALVDVASPQASMLFHSVTMIVPNANALTMTNGVRVEWLNSFTYFANIGLYAVDGSTGFNGNYGAEIRSIGSANVYGRYGAYADGPDTLMYLINYNFGYVGSGKDATNDPTLTIQANETVELNSGKIYYQSQDQGGTFRVGDDFFVDFETGNTSFDTSGLDITGATSLTIKNGVNETVINSTYLTTGNYRVSGNLIETLRGDVDIVAASGTTNLTLDVNIPKDLDITGDFNLDGELVLGNQTTDTVTFDTPLDQNLNPDIHLTYNLGSSDIVWQDVYLKEANIDDVTVRENIVESSTTDVDLELKANGTGIVNVQESATIEQNLTVDGTTTTQSVNITGLVTHVGDTTQVGTRDLTGNLDISNNLTVTVNAYFPNVRIVDNTIYTTTTDEDLVLGANGTGIINTLTNNVRINNDLDINGTTYIADATVIARTTADEFSTNDILISGNTIETTVTNSNLELTGNGTGGVLLETSKFTSNTLSSTDNVVFVPGTAKQLIVDTTASIKVPAGTNLDRPTKARGDLRFNTADNTYEGFDGSASRGFGAVYSADRLTSVKATKTSNILQFTTNSNLSMDITSTRVRLNGLYIDALQMDGSTTQAINSDLTFSPNGTGLNIVEQVTFDANNFQNDNTSTPLTFAATNHGYLKITGTNGFVIPYGGDADRPATPETGDLRWNTDRSYMEVYDGTQYNSAAGVGESVTADFMREETDLWSLILG